MSPLAFAQSQKARIKNDESIVYTQPDFDAQVLTTLPAGGVFDVSLKNQGPFYRIRVKQGVLGWIADTDLQLSKRAASAPAPEAKPAPTKQNKKTEKAKAKVEPAKPRKPFLHDRFRGPMLEIVQFKESTLGGHPTDNLSFYGAKFAGENTLMDGAINIETNLAVHLGAPSYYQAATSKSADGWVLLADFLFLTANPLSKSYYYFYGFGPVFRYSHFDLSLVSSTGKTTSYSAEDMNLGVLFNFGFAFKISSYALRIDGKYFIEKEMYPAFGASFLFPF